MNKTGILAGGIGIGAGLMFVLDPDRGARRRALLRDKAARTVNKTGDALDATSRDLAQRAQGVVAATRARLRAEPIDDDVLRARVRSKLGRIVSHAHAIQVSARAGRVTLSGPILASEMNDLLAAVERVRGVAEVENRLEPHKTADNIPALQGGAPRPGERSELMQENWPPAVRLLVGAAGGTLVVYGGMRRDGFGAGLAVVGASLVARGVTNLEFRRLTGVGAGRRAVDIQKTIDVIAPIEQVYDFWLNYENFPRFMRHVRDIRATASPGQSHWTVAGPAGAPVEFDAVITDQRLNEVLAWKTIEGSPVEHAGLVRFDPNPDGSTRVHLRVSYNPPAGALGHALAALLGGDLKTKMDQDLVRMKTLIETGRPPHDAAKPWSESAGMVH
jgi:uncharacterized membrane protein